MTQGVLLVRLLARARSDRHTDLTEKIIATVASYRRAEDLVAFIDGSAGHGTDISDDVLSRVSAQAGIETISNVVQLYNARKAANAQLFRVLADSAGAETLTGVGAHLAARGWQNLADELLQAALEHPERYTGAETAALLAGISRRTALGRWPHGNIVWDVVRRLHNRFSTDGASRWTSPTSRS